MSTVKALGIDSILDEIIWHLHAGSCTIEKCRGAALELSSVLFRDDKCFRSHRKSLGQILTVSKKWFRTTVPHLWGFYIDNRALSRFVTSTSRTQANTGGYQSTVRARCHSSHRICSKLMPIVTKRRKVTSDVPFRTAGSSTQNISKG
jgi:hypothetical protein